MDIFIQILVSGLSLGGMYALSAAGLALIWGALGMLNMSHGVMITVGGYLTYLFAGMLGFPPVVALVLTMVSCALLNWLVYLLVVSRMYAHKEFQTNIIIATIGLAIFGEAAILALFGAYPIRQPIFLEGGFHVGQSFISAQQIAILFGSFVLALVMGVFLRYTRTGRAIRATADTQVAAKLMGVSVQQIFATVMALSGVLAAASGIMLTSITTLAPTTGQDPMIRAFIICAVAGLGSVPGALVCAIALGIFEVFIQYFYGARYAMPALLVLVVCTLLIRPSGLFGQQQATRI